MVPERRSGASDAWSGPPLQTAFPGHPGAGPLTSARPANLGLMNQDLVVAITSFEGDSARLVKTAGSAWYGRRRKYAGLQLHEAAAVAVSIADALSATVPAGVHRAAPIEALVRLNVERAVALAWVASQEDPAVTMDRIVKRNAERFISSGFVPDDATLADADLLADPLPSITSSAQDHAPELLEPWNKLSHLSHPLVAMPELPNEAAWDRLVARVSHAAEVHVTAVDRLIASMLHIEQVDPIA